MESLRLAAAHHFEIGGATRAPGSTFQNEGFSWEHLK
jgi:hypothetical protein